MIRLKELREKKGLSQKNFAKQINVAQNTVSNWENGNRQIDSETSITIANFFNVSIDYLLGREEKKEKPTEVDELSENTKVLMDFVKTVPDDKVDLLLKVMKSIVEDE